METRLFLNMFRLKQVVNMFKPSWRRALRMYIYPNAIFPHSQNEEVSKTVPHEDGYVTMSPVSATKQNSSKSTSQVVDERYQY